MRTTGAFACAALSVACGGSLPIGGDSPRVVQVVAGAQHTCALLADGGVWCWGLGDAVDGSGNAVVRPRRVPGVQAQSLAAGDNTTCAITEEREVMCWGARAPALVAVDGKPLPDVRGVALGAGFGCAATPVGVYCWGTNLRGELARPLDFESSAEAVLALPGSATLLGAGRSVLAHNAENQLCAWGDNSSQVITASNEVGLYTSPHCETVLDVVQLAVGSEHACVLGTAGAVRCWGERYYGQLGLGGSRDDTASIPPYGAVTSLSAPAVALVAGLSHTCALLEDGSVACFGLNLRGQVGSVPPPDEIHVLEPTKIAGLASDVVSLGAGSSALHTCAVTRDGAVQCWGSNSAGQLGSGAGDGDVNETRFSTMPLAVQW